MSKRCYVGSRGRGFEAFCTDVPARDVRLAHPEYRSLAGPLADMEEAREVARLANAALDVSPAARRALAQVLLGRTVLAARRETA